MCNRVHDFHFHYKILLGARPLQILACVPNKRARPFVERSKGDELKRGTRVNGRPIGPGNEAGDNFAADERRSAT
jgi:hypothetical protein